MLTARRIVPPAVGALRAYWGTAVLLAAAVAAALAVLLPSASLVGPGAGFPARLGVPAAGSLDLGVVWGEFVRTPDAVRRTAILGLSHLVLGVAAGVIAVTWLTALALSAARATARGPEIVIRRAVGATRLNLLGAALLECAFIAAAALAVGGAAGLVAARAALGAWPGAVGPAAPAVDLVTTAATVLGLVAGALLPLAFARPGASLVAAEEASLALVVPAVQLGVSLTVLVAGSLLGARARALAESGGRPGVTGRLFTVSTRDPTPAGRAAAFGATLRVLGDEPSIEAASLASPGTAIGLGPVDVVGTDCGACSWGGLPLPWHAFFATHFLVSPDTFRTLGLRILAGRGITAADRWGGRPVAVVSSSLATLHFEPAGAVGRTIVVGHGGDRYTVVGVVEDRRGPGFGGAFEPPDAVYLSVLQVPAPAVELLVRSAAPAAAGAAAERALRRALGTGLAAVSSRSEAGLLAAEAAPLAWFGRLFGAAGGALTVIAILGVFAVMWLWVTSVLRELGVRRSVGARRRDVLGYVLGRAVLVAVAGAVIGAWLGTMAWDALASVVTGLPSWDAGTALRYAALLGVAALAGALVPAWRASRATPSRLLSAA